MSDDRKRSPSILLNQSYAMQRVTGQQRYAREISRRLLELDGFEAIQPSTTWSRSALRVWLWVMTVLPLEGRSSVVLSLTARAPVWQRRHVLVVHDLFVLSNPEWFSRTYVLTHAPLLRFQLRTAAALVAVSQPVADSLAQYDAPVHVAANAPSEVFLAPAENTDEPGEALTARGLEDGRYFLTVGSMDPRKNLSALARAYGALSDKERQAHPLVVVGAGSGIFRKQVLQWAPEVIDAGYVSDTELRQLYRGALAVVFVSKAEGFGLPLVEAAAAGTRGLVISDIPVFRWICGEEAHYVEPSSVDSMTAGLRAAVASPRPPQIDLSRFSWAASATVVADLCRSVVAAARPRSWPRQSRRALRART